MLALGYPEEHGGVPGDVFHQIVLAEEMSRCGAGGVVASLLSHTIGLPPLVAHASSALQAKVIPPVIRGEKISALAVTEPTGGSDVAALQCKAVRDGDHYVVTGEKVFITSGMRADFFTVAVRTDPRRVQPSRSCSVRATTLVARRRSSSTMCSSARLALDSRTVRGPAP